MTGELEGSRLPSDQKVLDDRGVQEEQPPLASGLAARLPQPTPGGDEERVLEFRHGLLGYDEQRRFLYVTGERHRPFEFLFPLEPSEIQTLTLLGPRLIRPDYALDLA